MPDKRSHRGPHPEDGRLFAPEAWPALRAAVADLSWLLTRGYRQTSAVKLVGDRHGLEARQRTAVARSACADDARQTRARREVPASALAGQTLDIDGYNLLTTVEAALGGGVVLRAQDGCFRDMASMHGTWRRVEETLPAIGLVCDELRTIEVGACRWYLDRPVSNSGRLKQLLLDAASQGGWSWSVELVDNPDRLLVESPHVVASADSWVLDHCARWVNLARAIVEGRCANPVMVDLS